MVDLPEPIQVKFNELDEVAVIVLRKAKQYGKVYIITNATYDWVALSAHKYLPKTYVEIQTDVKIISAREKYM